MRKLLQKWFRAPVMRLADKYSSRPEKVRVHQALTNLYASLKNDPGKKGPVLPFNTATDSFIIFSDQHKGAKNGSDDFAIAEKNYLSALDHYFLHKYHLLTLGDVEELWENLFITIKKHNVPSFTKEALFLKEKRFTKLFGNHDLMWGNDPFASLYSEQIFGEKVKAHEGVLLQTEIKGKQLDIFLTHGHQGDQMSDGNWFSKWFIANVWAPLQSYLGINPNTPAYDNQLKSEHNKLMYEWVAIKENTLLITGHTHQPVFGSLTHLERLYKQLWQARLNKNDQAIATIEAEILKRKMQGQTIPDFSAYRPGYFNSGCCCFDDGTITGIEISGGMIRLIKWFYNAETIPERKVLEELALSDLVS